MSKLASIPLIDRVRLLTGESYFTTPGNADLGFEGLWLVNGPAGPAGIAQHSDRRPALVAPGPTGLAATFDVDLVERVGELLGRETAAQGSDVLLTPVVNFHRSAFGGRNFEAFSEDVALTAAMGAAMIRGIQSAGVAACVKHLAGNDVETFRLSADVRIDDKLLHETLLRPFEEAVLGANVRMIMAAYNRLNGTPMVENAGILTEVVRHQWGSDAVIVCDWRAARSTVETALSGLDLVMPGPAGPWGESLATAVEAGLVPDELVTQKVERLMSLRPPEGRRRRTDGPPPRGVFAEDADARELLRETAAASVVQLTGSAESLDIPRGATVALIGDAVLRPTRVGGGSAMLPVPERPSLREELLALRPDLAITEAAGGGLHRYPLPFAGDDTVITASLISADGTVLYSEAVESFDLMWGLGDGRPVAEAAELIIDLRPAPEGLSEDSPLASERRELTLWGLGTVSVPGLFEPVRLAGADALSHPDTFMRPPSVAVTFDWNGTLTIRAAIADFPVMRLVGALTQPGLDKGDALAHAVREAASADVAVVVVGTTEHDETEGVDRQSLELPGWQDELVRRVSAVARRTVAIVNAGGAVLLPWADDVDAVLYGWYAGQEGLGAWADVLTGEREPRGRLPFGIPSSDEQARLASDEPQGEAFLLREPFGYRRSAGSARFPFGSCVGSSDWDDYDLEGSVSDGFVISARNVSAGNRRRTLLLWEEDEHGRRLVGWSQLVAGPGERVSGVVTLDRRAGQEWAGSEWRPCEGAVRYVVADDAEAVPVAAAG